MASSLSYQLKKFDMKTPLQQIPVMRQSSYPEDITILPSQKLLMTFVFFVTNLQGIIIVPGNGNK